MRTDRVIEAAAGGREIDGLQHTMDSPAEGGAVAALVPRRQLEVAGVLGQAGVGGFIEPVGGSTQRDRRTEGTLELRGAHRRRPGAAFDMKPESVLHYLADHVDDSRLTAEAWTNL